MRRFVAYPFGIVSLFSVACGGEPSAPPAGSASDLASSALAASCSAPVRSADGAYVALDECPHGGPGSLVRITIATGQRDVVATYAATDRVESLGARGANLYFAIRHEVDARGLATKGIDVQVHDWALRAARTVAATDGAAHASSLGTLLLSEDESAIAFAPGDDGHQVFVASVGGTGAATAFDVGPTADLRWATSKNAFALIAPDTQAWTGEAVTSLAPGGDGVFAATTKHVALETAMFGQGGTRAQMPLRDGSLLGTKGAGSQATTLATVDLATGTESVIDTGVAVTLVSDLGADVLYTKLVSANGTSTRTLVKAPRAGGAPTVLATTSSANDADLRFAYETIALDAGGAYGIFGTTTAGKAEKSLVKLDGSVPAVVLGAKTLLGDVVGTKVLAIDASSAARQVTVIDLVTGTTSSLGNAGNGATAYLAGDGTVVELTTCTMAAGGLGTGVRRLGIATATSATAPTVDCAYRPWASLPLAAPASDALVFYGSRGAFPSYVYDVGFVLP